MKASSFLALAAMTLETVSSMGSINIGPSRTPDVHRPRKKDDWSLIEKAKAKRERKRLKALASQGAKSPPQGAEE